MTLIVARRFCGPPTSANGGYFAGLLAAHARRMPSGRETVSAHKTLSAHNSLSAREALSLGQALSVRLKAPPPLDTALSVTETPQGHIEVRHGERIIGEAIPTTLDIRPPAAPEYREAVEASRNFIGFRHHPFPTCFVCGVDRAHGDGLCIFAGRVPGRDIVAAPWTPDATLDRGDGKVRPEFISAALDCPGGVASNENRTMLLAQFATRIDRAVAVGEPCVLIGWSMGSEGRKHQAGTALFGADGGLYGQALALWIEPRGAPEVALP